MTLGAHTTRRCFNYKGVHPNIVSSPSIDVFSSLLSLTLDGCEGLTFIKSTKWIANLYFSREIGYTKLQKCQVISRREPGLPHSFGDVVARSLLRGARRIPRSHFHPPLVLFP